MFTGHSMLKQLSEEKTSSTSPRPTLNGTSFQGVCSSLMLYSMYQTADADSFDPTLRWGLYLFELPHSNCVLITSFLCGNLAFDCWAGRKRGLWNILQIPTVLLASSSVFFKFYPRPNGLLSSVRRRFSLALIGAFHSLFNKPLNLSVPNCWWPVTIVSISKYGSSTVLPKRLPVLNWLIIPRLCSMNPPGNPFHFAYTSNRSTLDAFSSIVHHTCKSSDASMKFVRCLFRPLDCIRFCPTNCPTSKPGNTWLSQFFISMLSDYLTSKAQYARVDGSGQLDYASAIHEGQRFKSQIYRSLWWLRATRCRLNR